MPSFSIPLSGLSASSTALAAISNNIANLNTVGYKDSRPEFRDLFYQQVGSSGSGNPVEVGAGATIGSIDSVLTQGSIENTGVSTDIAIQGNGFFVTDNNGLRSYTRAGNFSQDPAGNLITADGAQVLGFPAANGSIDQNQPITALSVGSGQVSPPKATGNVTLQMNLDAQAGVGDAFNTSSVVYDSLGNTHVLGFAFTKTAGGTWSYSITVPSTDVGGTGDPIPVQTGTMTFDGSGQLSAMAVDTTPASATIPYAGAVNSYDVLAADGKTVLKTVYLGISGITIPGLADGANDITFDWNVASKTSDPSNPNESVSQLAGPSTTSATQQDGFPTGTLMNFSITADGIIQGTFSNGQTRAMGQIAIANFPNTQGLERSGSNAYLGTLGSGAANIGIAGTGGRGTLAGGALELSNVDIATEFSRLILAQRGFQANARTVTAFDEITQEAINLKR